jgi:sulfotransferase
MTDSAKPFDRSLNGRAIHFISGLPRSGSTLLAALLRQNPRIHATVTSPLIRSVQAVIESMSARHENAGFISDQQRGRIARGIFERFYGEDFRADVLFDTNRGWTARMPLLQELFPGSKVIACVRETGWIIDSFERLARLSPLQPSALYGFTAGGNVYSRADLLSNGEGTLGFAYNALKEAFYGEYSHHLLVVSYESLVAEPLAVLRGIYDFIGEPEALHDPDNVESSAPSYDQRLSSPGLHAVRRQVRAIPRKTILPVDLFNRYAHDAFWLEPSLNIRGVRIL